ncbi:MAG: glycosyltransferase family 2 protein [Alsobacter sp.]
MLPPALAFLVRHGFDSAQLAETASHALALGLPALDVLLAEQACSEDIYYRLLAAEVGVPFIAAPEIDGDVDLSRLSACSVARLRRDDGPDLVAAPRGDLVAHWLGATGKSLARTGRFGITTPARLEAALVRALARQLATVAAQDLPDSRPDLSARGRPTGAQVAILLLVELVLVFALVLDPFDTLVVAGAALSVGFVLQISLRWASRPHWDPVAPWRGPLLADGALPIYTVLIPLYREAAVLPDLLAALGRLDYPGPKLDIKLLIEAEDHETRDWLRRHPVSAPVHVVVCPPGYPRTKPRALNIGLRLARGQYLVIYDAEDRPERDQLRLAATIFAAAPSDVACLQASLAVDNAGESWISRCFAQEYAELFDVALPGFAELDLPIPLGGTSNHFRTDTLRRTGAWDAWNVTEDADLGLRLARGGYRVKNLPSTTWEEAPISVRAWLPQRTRWLKGWLQTSLVHGLPSRRHLREVGPVGTVAIFCHSYALSLSCLSWPAFSVGFVWSVATTVASETAADPLIATSHGLCALVLLLGVVTVIRGRLMGSARRGLPFRLSDLLLMPVYFLLVSLAAWRAVWELITAPHHWSKTQHGVSRGRRRS